MQCVRSVWCVCVIGDRLPDCLPGTSPARSAHPHSLPASMKLHSNADRNRGGVKVRVLVIKGVLRGCVKWL